MARVVVESDISSDGKLHYFVYLKYDTEKESYQKVEVLIHHTDEHGNKVELIQNVARDADTAPETVSARSTEVETESNTTRHADEATLPKNGEEQERACHDLQYACSRLRSNRFSCNFKKTQSNCET